MKKTALHAWHLSHGARMAEFAGWEMPIQYEKGTLAEHQAVREAVGMFDVSHMGRIIVRGPEAEALLDYLSTNKIAGSPIGKAIYTVWPNEQGGCVDDLIVYRLGSEEFFVVVNAGNREKDLNHLQHYAKDFDVTIESRYDEDGILAIQGPKAPEIIQKLIPETAELKPMRLGSFIFEGEPVIIARTGYTGEKGYELMGPNHLIPKLWERCFELGAGEGIEPVGLGARDTLRLEMGFALYGHELTDEIASTESVSAWTVKMDKEDFLGKKALEAKTKLRHTYGVVIEGGGIPRVGYRVLKDGQPIGTVTSGNQALSIGKAIALLLLDQAVEEGDVLEIEIRKRTVPAKVVALPFLKSLGKQ